MRLMLGTNNEPSLLVRVADDYNPTNFKFSVINGAWEGEFTNGYITVFGCPGGDFSSLDKVEILTDNQDRLRCNFTDWDSYNEVFANFHNPNYVAPEYKKVLQFDYWDDDIAF